MIECKVVCLPVRVERLPREEEAERSILESSEL